MKRTKALLVIGVIALVVIAGCMGGSDDGGDGSSIDSSGGIGQGMESEDGGNGMDGSDAGDGGYSGDGGDGMDGADAGDGGDGGDGMSGGDGADADEGDQVGYSVGGAKDVNTFRKNIKNDYLPLPQSMTYEGLFYDYYFDTGKKERCNKLFCPSYSRAVSQDPLSGETDRYMTVGLNSGLSEKNFQRKKLNLVIVLDTSGSMKSAFDRYYYDGGEKKEASSRIPKMRAATKSIKALTDHLKEGDRLGIVTYSGGARKFLEMDNVDDINMDRLKNRLESIQAGGSTNLDAGMSKANEMMEKFENADPSEYENRIIYITDAQPNRGRLSVTQFDKRLEANAQNRIHSTFIGVGVDFNSKLVNAITDTRGANYYSVKSVEQFKKRMDDNFEYMVTPLVFDLSLQVESEGYEIEEIYGSTAADESSGEILKVNTLFPSESEGGRTKGGVVLLKLDKETNAQSSKMKLTASYETREGDERKTTKTVTFRDVDPESFENSGIRKAVVLSRYADLMKNWAIHERNGNSGEVERRESIDPPNASKWERGSMNLRVSKKYEDRIDIFEDYFEQQMNELGDMSMKKELEILEKLEGEDDRSFERREESDDDEFDNDDQRSDEERRVDEEIQGWEVRKWGSYHGRASKIDDRLRLNVYKCHNIVVKKDLGHFNGPIEVSFDWRTWAEGWAEKPDWHILVDGKKVPYRVVEGEDVKGVGSARSPDGQRSSEITAKADAEGHVTLVYSLEASNNCGDSDHTNTYLQIDDIEVNGEEVE